MKKERKNNEQKDTAVLPLNKSGQTAKTNSHIEIVGEESRLDQINELRKGYSYKQFTGMTKDIPLSYGEWPKILHISKRTLDRHKNENRFFDLHASERIFEICELYVLGIEVFEDTDKLDRWLFRPNPILDGQAPKDLFDTFVGLDLIKEQLLQIEYGILA